MKTTAKYLIFGIMIFALVLTSCSKDGEPGATGPQGVAGADGIDGNANVTSYLFENQSFSNIGSNTFMLPTLTQDILDNGFLLGYIRNGGDTSWLALPYFFYNLKNKYLLINSWITRYFI